MFVRRFQKFLFAGALLAVAPLLAGADEGKKPEVVPAPKKAEIALVEHVHAPAVISTGTPGGCGTATVTSSAPAVSGPCGPTAAVPAMKTVRETVMVPEQYTTTRTVNKKETREESYTAYKYETVSETKTRNVTVYKNVTETVMEARTTTVKVPVTSTVTVMQTHNRIESYTEMVSKTVDKGSYVTQEVPAGPSLCDRLSAMKPKFGGFGKHKGGCSDPCATSCAAPACEPACPAPVKMKCVKVWVPNCVTECHPVCKTRCVKECVPVTKQVCSYKCETKTEMVPVCKTKCVPECKTETYTECKKVCVPYTAKRCVEVCVPVTENVTATRMVCKVIEKQVPADVAPCGPAAGDCGNGACGASAGDPCATAAPCMSLGGKLKGLFGKFGCKKSSCCN